MKNKEFNISAAYSKCERVLKGSSVPKKPSYSFRGSDNPLPSKIDTTAFVGAKVPQFYTGTKMIGIATLHKSNAVPVFSEDDAKDISKMRRG